MFRGYIYMARIPETGHIYIGQTTLTITSRWIQHVKRAAEGTSKMSRAIMEYGENAFEVTEVDQAYSQYELNLKEQFWIEETGAYTGEFGLNSHAGGEQAAPVIVDGVFYPGINKAAEALDIRLEALLKRIADPHNTTHRYAVASEIITEQVLPEGDLEAERKLAGMLDAFTDGERLFSSYYRAAKKLRISMPAVRRNIDHKVGHWRRVTDDERAFLLKWVPDWYVMRGFTTLCHLNNMDRWGILFNRFQEVINHNLVFRGGNLHSHDFYGEMSKCMFGASVTGDSAAFEIIKTGSHDEFVVWDVVPVRSPDHALNHTTGFIAIYHKPKEILEGAEELLTRVRSNENREDSLTKKLKASRNLVVPERNMKMLQDWAVSISGKIDLCNDMQYIVIADFDKISEVIVKDGNKWLASFITFKIYSWDRTVQSEEDAINHNKCYDSRFYDTSQYSYQLQEHPKIWAKIIEQWRSRKFDGPQKPNLSFRYIIPHDIIKLLNETTRIQIIPMNEVPDVLDHPIGILSATKHNGIENSIKVEIKFVGKPGERTKDLSDQFMSLNGKTIGMYLIDSIKQQPSYIAAGSHTHSVSFIATRSDNVIDC
ncbi:hypothetical protein CHU95_00100 [Niveispirillum lacus]|uniref:GIY-YIG domain-containing protein n=1 Tax=Niveispirillum lacus TaxID=1981099 RepID=A0A255Z976_9PROT|nr:GIY-YIG nuclease family protein [Niveispirillum lacus]OYQ37961.1 hypothetical protein CHU95_00100 [Niveispirillum lacus]